MDVVHTYVGSCSLDGDEMNHRCRACTGEDHQGSWTTCRHRGIRRPGSALAYCLLPFMHKLP